MSRGTTSRMSEPQTPVTSIFIRSLSSFSENSIGPRPDIPHVKDENFVAVAGAEAQDLIARQPADGLVRRHDDQRVAALQNGRIVDSLYQRIVNGGYRSLSVENVEQWRR